MGFKEFIRPTALTFVGREHIAGNVYSYNFKPDSELKWLAGQHGMLELKLPNGKTSRRMFSLSSAPTEEVVTVTSRWHGEQASEYKRALWSLKPGDKARLRGPVGPMFIRDSFSRHVLIAGGIGITPFRSIIKEAHASNKKLNLTLLYANREPENIPFQEELDGLAVQFENLQIKYIVAPESISDETLRQAEIDGKDTMFYLSGPPVMIRQYRRILKQVGVSMSRVKSDPFLGYK